MNNLFFCGKGYLILGFSIVLWLTGCAPMSDLTMISVPEESGLNFVRFADDDDRVVGPVIREVRGEISWYAPSFISISPDGEYLAYNGRKDGSDHLFIKRTSGGRSVNQRTFRNDLLDMSFSPDGEYLAFTDQTSLGNEIKLIRSLSGSSVQQITSGYSDVGPTFSPDGNEIFFTRTRTERITNPNDMLASSSTTIAQSYLIWSYNLESSLFTQYTEGFTPNISPDGELLIITRNNRGTGKGEIWSVNINSGQEILILGDNERGYSSPQISPDGEYLAVVGSTPSNRDRPANLDIYTVKMDGSNLTQHTFHPAHDVSPVWSPDGNHIFFISRRGSEEGRFNIWRMNMELD